VKSAHRTRENGSSSWPTISVNESKNSVGKSQLDRNSIPLDMQVKILGQAAPANPSTAGSRQGLWVTPQQRDFRSAEGNENRWENPDRSRNLNDQIKQQATEDWPTVSSAGVTGGPTGLAGGSGNRAKMKRLMGGEMNSKLNPRWVETLMGLPVGWTMPSCASPVTTALTNCDSLATESSQPPQNGLFEF
jgi:hypothetical protein